MQQLQCVRECAPLSSSVPSWSAYYCAHCATVYFLLYKQANSRRISPNLYEFKVYLFKVYFNFFWLQKRVPLLCEVTKHFLEREVSSEIHPEEGAFEGLPPRALQSSFARKFDVDELKLAVVGQYVGCVPSWLLFRVWAKGTERGVLECRAIWFEARRGWTLYCTWWI